EPVKPEPAQFIRNTEHSEAPKKIRDVELAMVEREQKQEKQTRERLSSLQNFQEQAFCPECGTIRSDENTVCLHCGYDPIAKNKSASTFKKLAYIIIAIVIFIAVILFAGLPYYQQFALKGKIENGLQLAFDTRNQVTEFIERTNFWPNQNIDANLPKSISNDVIESIVIGEKSVITITLRSDIIGNTPDQTIIFTPNILKGRMVWNCTQGTLSNEYRPKICKKTN
ncbi:MAG TPA: pilin, partial [Gammaproteobacteria bacterium]